MAATIFSSLTPATLFTWTLGGAFSKSAITLSKTPISRSPGVKPLQTAIVYCLLGSNACAVPELLSPLPPQAASPRALRPAAAKATVAFVTENLTLLSSPGAPGGGETPPAGDTKVLLKTFPRRTLSRSGSKWHMAELVKFSNDLRHAHPTRNRASRAGGGARRAGRAGADRSRCRGGAALGIGRRAPGDRGAGELRQRRPLRPVPARPGRRPRRRARRALALRARPPAAAAAGSGGAGHLPVGALA